MSDTEELIHYRIPDFPRPFHTESPGPERAVAVADDVEALRRAVAVDDVADRRRARALQLRPALLPPFTSQPQDACFKPTMHLSKFGNSRRLVLGCIDASDRESRRIFMIF